MTTRYLAMLTNADGREQHLVCRFEPEHCAALLRKIFAYVSVYVAEPDFSYIAFNYPLALVGAPWVYSSATAEHVDLLTTGWVKTGYCPNNEEYDIDMLVAHIAADASGFELRVLRLHSDHMHVSNKFLWKDLPEGVLL